MRGMILSMAAGLLLAAGLVAVATDPVEVTDIIVRARGLVLSGASTNTAGALKYSSGSLYYYNGSAWKTVLPTDGDASTLEGFGAVDVASGVGQVIGGTGIVLRTALMTNEFGVSARVTVDVSPTGLGAVIPVGDVSGTLGALVVTKLRGDTVKSDTHKAVGALLVWSGSQWVPTAASQFFSDYEQDLVYSAEKGAINSSLSANSAAIAGLLSADTALGVTLGTVAGDLDTVEGRVDALESASGSFPPIARMSEGLQLAYSDANTITVSGGSIFGVAGEVYTQTGSANVDLVSPGTDFQYIFVDASGTTPSSGTIVYRSSVEDPVQNSYGQWVDASTAEDRYVGCVLWSGGSIVKFTYNEGAYVISDPVLSPTNATSLATWSTLLTLGTDQLMDGHWVSPTRAASTLLPVTASGALVTVAFVATTGAGVPGPHTAGGAVGTYEQALLYPGYILGHLATTDNAAGLQDVIPTEFSVRYGTALGDGISSLQDCVRTQWINLGASRNLRIVGDNSPNPGADDPVYADWAILGWKEKR